MATQTFPLLTNATVQARQTSPSVVVPAGVTRIDIALAAPAWDTTVGTWQWGMELSRDGGATWDFLIGQTIPIGQRTKSGGMPMMGETSDALVGLSIRGYAESSVPLVVTITATVS